MKLEGPDLISVRGNTTEEFLAALRRMRPQALIAGQPDEQHQLALV